MRRPRNGRNGDALIEFTLVGIPLIFVLISIFEISRGMWVYHTLEYAVTEATRYAAVHGEDCWYAPNTCTAKISDIAAVVKYVGVGLPPDQLNLTFVSNAGPVSCLLTDCLNKTDLWPPAGANLRGMNVTISASFPFSSAIVMFWPGAGPGMTFPTINLPATATDRIQF